jgi:hypothetical protein
VTAGIDVTATAKDGVIDHAGLTWNFSCRSSPDVFRFS